MGGPLRHTSKKQHAMSEPVEGAAPQHASQQQDDDEECYVVEAPPGYKYPDLRPHKRSCMV